MGVEDVSDFVRKQRAHVEARCYDRLVTPRERVYPVGDLATVRRLGLAARLGSDESA